MKQEITGKTALVTGASSGIGQGIAIALSNLGVNLHLCARSFDKLETTRQQCNPNVSITLHTVDLADAAQIEAMMSSITKLDYVLNVAGMIEKGTIETQSLASFDRHYAINVRAPFIIMQQSLPLLRQSEQPEIINIGSVVAHKAYADQCAYVTSKHALMGLSKEAAKDLYQEQIRVHILCPGGVNTGMMDLARPDLKGQGDQNIQVEDIADIVCFILTHHSNAVIDEIDVHRYTKEPF